MNRDSQNPRVPAAQITPKYDPYGVRVHFFFASGYLSIPFRLQEMAVLNEGDEMQMWEFIPV